jgi:IS30 family transposase
MSKYKQLTQEQRYQIYSYSKIGYSQTKIASEIGVHKSTISRELTQGCEDIELSKPKHF